MTIKFRRYTFVAIATALVSIGGWSLSCSTTQACVIQEDEKQKNQRVKKRHSKIT